MGPPANTCLLGRARAGILLLRAEGNMERGPKEAGDPETDTQEARPEAEVSPAAPPPPTYPGGFSGAWRLALIPAHPPTLLSAWAEDRSCSSQHVPDPLPPQEFCPSSWSGSWAGYTHLITSN